MNITVEEQVTKQLRMAESYVQSGADQQAAGLYETILSTQPDHLSALVLLAGLHQKHNNFHKALQFLSRAVAQAPDNTAIHMQMAQSYVAMDDPHSTVQHLEHIMRLEPQNLYAYNALLSCMLNLRLKEQNKAVVSEHAFAHPPPQFQRLQIEVTTWCNLKCAGCPRTIDMDRGKWTNTHMPFAQFQKILDNVPPSQTLCLQGVGESTLHPEFLEMVRYAKDTGKFRAITVNSNALARPVEYYQRLKEAGLTFISISVDSFDPEIAEACRSGTKVEKLRERLSSIAELFRPQKTVVTIVISKRNIHDVQNTIDILAGIGNLAIELQTLIVYNPGVGDEYGLDAEDMKHVNNLPKLNAVKHQGLEFVGMDMQGNMQRQDIRCPRPFSAPYITADGYLTPCCTCEDPAVLGHVNVAEKPFAELWRLPSVQQWLRHYVGPTVPSMCIGCCFHTG